MVESPPLIRPTPGSVRAAFRYDRATPFARGQRRGAALATTQGARVAAPCRGRVTFTGRTPRGQAVSLRCGRWAVVVVGVSGNVQQGTTVAAGRRIGRATGRYVTLSVRRHGDRWGYVAPRLTPVTPRTGTPIGRAPRPRVPSIAPARRTLPSPARRPVVVSTHDRSDRSVRVPGGAAVVGLALLALGLPTIRLRRRRRHAAATRRRSRAA